MTKCCPIDSTELTKKSFNNIEVDECPECNGVWLDKVELDQVEDINLDMDEIKGTLIYANKESSLECPVCEEKMVEFDYRLYGMEIEYCKNKHGWWLNNGEIEKIGELMDRRLSDMERKVKEEEEWEDLINRLKSPKLIDKVRNQFN